MAKYSSSSIMMIVLLTLFILAITTTTTTVNAECTTPLSTSDPNFICSNEGESLTQFYTRLNTILEDECMSTSCDSTSFRFHASIIEDSNTPGTFIFETLADCTVFGTGFYALVVTTDQPDVCQLQTTLNGFIQASQLTHSISGTPLILDPTVVIFSNDAEIVKTQCQDRCLLADVTTPEVDMEAVCFYIDTADNNTLKSYQYSTAGTVPAECIEPTPETLSAVDCSPVASCYKFQCSDANNSQPVDCPVDFCATFDWAISAVTRVLFDGSSGAVNTDTNSFPAGFDDCSVVGYTLEETDLTPTLSVTSLVLTQPCEEIDNFCATQYSACLTYGYTEPTTTEPAYGWKISEATECQGFDITALTQVDTSDIYSQVCNTCSDGTPYFAAEVGDLYYDITDLAVLKAEFIDKEIAGDLTDVTCTGYSFVAKSTIKYSTIQHANCPEPDIACQIIVSSVDYTDVTPVAITASEDQCKWECSYVEDVFTTCEIAITSTSVCTLDSKFTTIIPLSVESTAPVNPDVLKCALSCSLIVQPAPEVGDELVVADVTKTCLIDSYRPDDTYCFGSPVNSDTIRDVFCTWNLDDKIYYAGTINNCGHSTSVEPNMTSLTTTIFTPAPEKCTTEYLCDMDDGNDPVPCPCPSLDESDNKTCDDAGVITAPSSSCTITYTDGGDVETFTSLSVTKCCEFNESGTPGTTAGSNCGCDCLAYEWRCVCKTDGFDSTNEAFCDCTEPDVTDTTLCSADSACSIKPVSVRCVQFGVLLSDAVPDDEKCTGQDKPTITSYTCPPTTEDPNGSEQCPFAAPTCYNNNKTAADTYDCETCIDTTGAATSRTPICKVTYQDLTKTSDPTPSTIDINADCEAETITKYSTCISDIASTPGSYTRGDSVPFRWTYIGARPSTDSFTFQPITTRAINTFTTEFREPRITVLKSAGITRYIPSKTLQFPYITNLYPVDPTDTKIILAAKSTPLTIDACNVLDPACVSRLCTIDGTAGTCLNDSTCGYDATTTFTKCLCGEGNTGPTCQYDANCPVTTPETCFDNGFPLFNESCTKCDCNDEWTGLRCNTCAEASITAACTANHFVPSTSSSQCRCECFLGYGGKKCENHVVYASINLNIAPPSTLTIGTSWENDLDQGDLDVSSKYFIQWLSSQLATQTSISTIQPVECRAQQGSTYQYIVRFTQSTENNNAWNTYITPAEPFNVLQAGATALTSSDGTIAYDPLCTTGCTGTSPYPSRQVFVDCATDTTNEVCKTTYGTIGTEPIVDPPAPEEKKSKTGLIVGLVVGLTCGIILLIIIAYCVYKKMNGDNDDTEDFAAAATASTRKSSQDKRAVAQQETFPYDDDAPPQQAHKPPKAPKAPREPGASNASKPGRQSTDKKDKRGGETELTAVGPKSSSAGRKTQDDGALPVPWKQCTDHLGNLYYINMHTMESTFQRPV